MNILYFNIVTQTGSLPFRIGKLMSAVPYQPLPIYKISQLWMHNISMWQNHPALNASGIWDMNEK